MVLRALHLCSGYGGFELALRYAGIPARTVCHVERDAYAAAALVARMEETRLDQAPVWDDVTTFDGQPWRGVVDFVTAGFPCQPFSVAGKKLGTDDERWIWPDIGRIVAEVGPRFVFLENVPGVVRAGLGRVLGDLAHLGFDAEWSLLPATAVGAPHQRERFWCLGYPRGEGGREIARELRGGSRVDRSYDNHLLVGAGEGLGARVGDTDGEGRGPIGQHEGLNMERHPDGSGCAELADAEGARRQAASSGGRSETGVAGLVGLRPEVDLAVGPGWWPLAAPGGGHIWPPGPDDEAGWRLYGGPQPSVRRGTDGATEWLADALHLGGNGLVPQCAAAALHLLLDRLEFGRDHDDELTDLDGVWG